MANYRANITSVELAWVAAGICQHSDPCNILQLNQTENYNND